VCTYIRYLNANYPKYEFSLPNIENLVENTIGYEMFSLMDGFSSYNQSWVILDDQHNTTFIMSWGTYYYKVMPLKFKNMGATNQRAMNYFFHEIMED